MYMSKSKVKAAVFLAAMFCLAHATPDDYRINQLGYYPAANKIVPIKGTSDSTFVLLDTDGNTVYNGVLSKYFYWSLSGDSVKHADFSDFRQEGTFWIKTSDKGMSPPVKISTNVLYDVSMASLKTFYYQRASMPLEEQYAGRFARPAGHPDTSCLFHSSSGKDEDTPAASSPGGWYDAGDYGKYIVNAGITLGNLFQFYENFGGYFGDSALNIPESGNNVDDLLDEAKYELDWMLTMQDSDGGVFHKLTTLQHASMTAAPEDDIAARYFIGKSTAATLDFAAVMAMAGRIYDDIEGFKGFADTCISRAERAWQWAVANPSEFFRNNPAGVGTGAYNDTIVNDEFMWAATELFITTSDTAYIGNMRHNIYSYNWPASWESTGRLAPLSVATVPNSLDSSIVTTVRQKIISQANSYIKTLTNHAYRIPNNNFFYWGSNAVFANAALFLVYAFKISDDSTYIKAAAEIADYLLGKNAVNYSFVTGYGFACTQNPHHRPSLTDTISDPVPGFLAGGPNGSPKSYSDASGSYETNEIAINWNAPSSALFAAINAVFGEKRSTPANGPIYLITCFEGPGAIEISPLKTTYEAGERITLIARPEEKQLFMGWGSPILSMKDTISFIINRDMKVSAKFGRASELVINGSFSNVGGWNFGRMGTGVGTGSIAGGEYHAEITNGGTSDFHIQIVQNGILLLEDATYVFTFSARADSNRTILADVARSGGDYSTYMDGVYNRKVSLTTEMQTFTFTFKMKEASDPSARITFNCGQSNHDVYFDNVSIKMLDPDPVIHKGAQRYGWTLPGFCSRGQSLLLQLSVVDPQKAWFKVFDAQGRMRSNMTPVIRTLSKGKHVVPVNSKFTPGLYLIRYFDGEKLMTSRWTNLVR